MIWTKEDHGLFIATHEGVEFIAYKVNSHLWRLEVHCGWYMFHPFKTRTDCYAAAERVIAALPILEDGK